MTRSTGFILTALALAPLALAGCSYSPSGSPTNGGVTQTTGIGSNGPASDSGGAAASAATHG